MGWLGWSEDQALKSDVNAIQIAYIGRCDMLRAIFGDGKKDPAVLPEFGPGMLSKK